MKALIITCALAWAACSANAQELWRSIEEGASEQQVLDHFSEAERRNPTLYDDGVFSVLIDDHTIAGKDFGGRFILVKGKLDRVVLISNSRTTNEPAKVFEYYKFEELLASKYGTPAFEMPATMRDPEFNKTLQNSFFEGELSVKLLCAMCGTDAGNLVISYDANRPEKTKDL